MLSAEALVGTTPNDVEPTGRAVTVEVKPIESSSLPLDHSAPMPAATRTPPNSPAYLRLAPITRPRFVRAPDGLSTVEPSYFSDSPIDASKMKPMKVGLVYLMPSMRMPIGPPQP